MTATTSDGLPLSTRIQDLGLRIEGTWIEPVLAEFLEELERAGIRKLKPDFYLADEWGVPFESISIGIPFYLARADLMELHMQRVGFVEGDGRSELLRYLRHEMGHVVNYAYRLHQQDEWVHRFGSFARPYEDEYRPEPFSRRFVRHLAGWYAQKHADEDWSETFAVWLTPGFDWRPLYAEATEARAKLEYCDRTLKALVDVEPQVNVADHHGGADSLACTLEEFYEPASMPAAEAPQPMLEEALRSICEDVGKPRRARANTRWRNLANFIRDLEVDLVAAVYRWTGHFPEPARVLVQQLVAAAERLDLRYAAEKELAVATALTALLTSLAMNHVARGSYQA